MAYGDDTKFEAWLAANGFVLPSGSPTSAQLRQRGSVHVNAHTFPGSPTEGFAQADAWPRVGATAYGHAIPSDVVPVAIEHASYAAGYFEAVNAGALTTRSSADQRIKREKVGPIETEFFDSGSDGAASSAVTIPMVEGLLAPFLTSASAGAAIFIV